MQVGVWEEGLGALAAICNLLNLEGHHELLKTSIYTIGYILIAHIGQHDYRCSSWVVTRGRLTLLSYSSGET